MDKLSIDGGFKLDGQIRISGAKNSALPILAGSLLTAEPVIISNAPHLHDVTTMIELLACLGVGVSLDCLLYTSPSPRDVEESRMPSSA